MSQKNGPAGPRGRDGQILRWMIGQNASGKASRGLPRHRSIGSDGTGSQDERAGSWKLIMSSTANLRSRRSAVQLHALAGVEREIRAQDSHSRRKYLREFNEAYRSYNSLL